MKSIAEKERRLAASLKELGRAAVAFSGGTDSALLLHETVQALGRQAFAMTIWSPLLSQRDREDIAAFVGKYEIPLVKVALDETMDAAFCENRDDRCYACKLLRLKALEEGARQWKIPWVLDGSNASDLMDYRPGMRALAESETVLSPLLECGFTKDEVRGLSRLRGLPTADKPAAACLASRIRTGVRIGKELLPLIDSAEEIVRLYLPDGAQVRARFDGRSIKIETDRENLPGLSAVFDDIRKELSALGLDGVETSTGEYRMGSVTSRPK